MTDTIDVWLAFVEIKYARPCNWTISTTDGQVGVTLSHITVIPRLTKIIRSGITFVSRNLRWPKRDFP